MSAAQLEVVAEEDCEVTAAPKTHEYRIEVTVREFHGVSKPISIRHEITVQANGELEAFKTASGQVKTKGYPWDEVSVRVIGCRPFRRKRGRAGISERDNLND